MFQMSASPAFPALLATSGIREMCAAVGWSWAYRDPATDQGFALGVEVCDFGTLR